MADHGMGLGQALTRTFFANRSSLLSFYRTATESRTSLTFLARFVGEKGF